MIVGFEFGDGLSELKAMFNFPVIEYESSRHVLYVPLLSLLGESQSPQSTLRIIVSEVFDLEMALRETVATKARGVPSRSGSRFFATGFIRVSFSQN